MGLRVFFIGWMCQARAWGEEPGEGERAKARVLAEEALGHMHEQRWAQAQTLLSQAYTLMPVPTLALLEGRALERLGRLIDARVRYERASRTELAADVPEAFTAAREEATRELARLERSIPRVTLMVRGRGAADPGLKLLLNGKILAPSERARPVLLDPGTHRVQVELAQEELASMSLTVVEGEQKSVFLLVAAHRPAPVSKAPSLPQDADPQRTAGWLAFGVGGAGLGFGIVTGFMMLDAKTTLDEACTATCPAAMSDELAKFRTTRTLSAVGYATGLVGAAVGTLLFLSIGEPSSPEQRVGFWSDGKQLGVRGSF